MGRRGGDNIGGRGGNGVGRRGGEDKQEVIKLV